jgi:DNA cross-link repair 1C protein
MSCFSGCFPSLPGVRCDRFDRTTGSADSSIGDIGDQFFLSHCHTDHMHGLNELARLYQRKYQGGGANQKIHCSEISKAFILNKFKSMPERAIVVIDTNTPKIVNVYDSKVFYKIKVTAIGANHCPGSVMFLFEKLQEQDSNVIEKRILYTGDFRFESQPLSKLEYLHDRAGHPLPIDEMYLDTTFCTPQYKTFPTRSEAESRIWEQCDKWIKRNGLLRNTRGKHVILLHLPARYGYERILQQIYEKSLKNWRVHINLDKWADYVCKGELMECTEKNPDKAPWIHACTAPRKDGRNQNKPLLKSLPCQ